MAEVFVSLAEARVYAEVQLKAKPVENIDLQAGDELCLRFSYRVYEDNLDEDLWVFRLNAQVEGEEEGIAERRHHDRKMFSDDLLSHVGLDIGFPAPGTYKVNYSLEASLSRRKWEDRAPHKLVSEGTSKGEFTVTVHE